MPEDNGKLNAVPVERNGKTLTFEPVKIKRGDYKDQEYLGLKVDPKNFMEVAEFLGPKVMVSILRGKTNGVLQSLFDQASTDKDEKPKPFDLEEWRDSIKKWSARGETMENLTTQIEELADELVALDWSTGAAAATRAQEIATEIGELRDEKEKKKKDRGSKKKEEVAVA